MATSEALFSVSMKTRNGTILTIRADDFKSFSDNISSAVTGNINLIVGALEDTMHPQDATAYIAQSLGGTIIDESKIGSGPIAPSDSNVLAPTCQHGVKKHKRGNGAKGPWQAWMCPSAKGTPDQCMPQWIKRGEPGWVA